MKYTLLFIIVLTVFQLTDVNVNAQNPKRLDSLLRILPSLPADTIKVGVYGSVSYLHSQIREFPSARVYADSVMWLAQQLNFEAGIARAHYFKAGIEQFEGNYSKALQHAQYSLQFSETKGDSFRIVNSLFVIGKIHKSLGEYDKSLRAFYRIVTITEARNDLEGLSQALNSMGGIYRELGKFNEAIDHYKKANATNKMLGHKKDYAMGLQNLANVYMKVNSYDTARQLYEEALRLVQDINKEYEEAIILGNLGNLYNALNQHEAALSYHLRSLTIKRKLPNKRSLTFAFHDVGNSYVELGRYKEADRYFKEALTLAKEIKAKDLLRGVYESLAMLAVRRKDFHQGYTYMNLSYQWKDSIFNEQSSRQINELEKKYETAKKDQQIVLLAKEKEIQAKEAQLQATLTKTFRGGLILVSLLAILIGYISWQKIKNQKIIASKDQEIKEVNFKQQISELEMRALQAQINPHFLFNCMNSINRMILSGENEIASIYLSKFSKLVRLILENAESSTVSLQSELALLQSYIELEGLRFKEKIEYKIAVDESIDKDAVYLPSMVLQPFVENAIWHGLMHKPEKGVLQISVKEKDNTLCCSIEDNGIGREKANELREQSVLKTKSMGVKITEERLRLLHKDKFEQAVNIVDLKDRFNHPVGTRVEINIPVLQA